MHQHLPLMSLISAEIWIQSIYFRFFYLFIFLWDQWLMEMKATLRIKAAATVELFSSCNGNKHAEQSMSA